MGFRKDFVWGTATAAYQIEGAAFEIEKGMNTWDVFTNFIGHSQASELMLDVGVNTQASTKGQKQRIRNNENGNVACDHYHRYEEDIELMTELGVKAYRFSINWARLIPDGTGTISAQGAQFYSDLVDALLEKGIEPYVTLFHWDYPQVLEDKGGWLNKESSDWFAEYAKVVVQLFGNRVKYYMTFNEFQCFVNLGYKTGDHAPGKTYSDGELVQLAHNVLLAHGKAVQVLREYQPAVQVSIAPCGRVYMPKDTMPQNIEAARKRYFYYDIKNFTASVGFWSDAIVLGVYQENYLKEAEKYLPKTWKSDLENIISQPLDFYCQNLYNGYFGVADEYGEFQIDDPNKGFPRTSNPLGWYVTPEVLYWGSKFLCDRYKLPFYITENGAGMCDSVSLDGKVHDPGRIDYIHRYLLQLRKLADEGYDIRGYFVWTLLDNFEWALGYYERMGLIWVDFETQERIPKDSFYWYKEIVATNGDNLD